MKLIAQLERLTRLWHVGNAAGSILEFTDGRTREDYETNILLRLAVERQLITVGEALNRAIKADPQLQTQITHAHGIISCRNRLIHNYPEIDNDRVWEIIRHDLPILVAEVNALLAADAPAGQNPA